MNTDSETNIHNEKEQAKLNRLLHGAKKERKFTTDEERRKYFRDYYHENNVVFNCPHCQKPTSSYGFLKHSKGLKCQLKQRNIEI